MATTLLLWAVLWIGASFPQATPPRAPDVFYVPTPPAVVDAMLELAKVGPNDVVYDLGCGDGRIPIAAAQKFGAHGVGIDIDPKRIEEATENAKAANVTDRVTFRAEDLFEASIGDATVVTLVPAAVTQRKVDAEVAEGSEAGHAHRVSRLHDGRQVAAGGTSRSWRPDDLHVAHQVI